MGQVFSWLGLNAVLLKFTWNILIRGPLILIAGIFSALKFLSGEFLIKLIFGNEQKYSLNNLPMAFLGILILSISLLALFWIINMGIVMLKDRETFFNAFRTAIWSALKSLPIFFAIPVLFFLFSILMNSFNDLMPLLFGSKTKNMADVLYTIGAPDYETALKYLNTDVAADNYGPPNQIEGWNIFAQIFTTICVLILLALLGISVFSKVIELFFLFLISPILTSSMVFDQGKRLLVWKEMVLSKFLAISASLFGIFLFSTVFSQLQQLIMSLHIKWITTTILLILAVIGCSAAMTTFSEMVVHFIGERAGARESLASIKQTFGVGMGLLAGGKLTAKAMWKTAKISTKLPSRFLVGKKGLNSAKKILTNNFNPTSSATKDNDADQNFRKNIAEAANISEKIAAAGLGVGGLAGVVASGFGIKTFLKFKKRRAEQKKYVDKYLRNESYATKHELSKLEKFSAKRDAKQIFKQGESAMEQAWMRQNKMDEQTFGIAKEMWANKDKLKDQFPILTNFTSVENVAMYLKKQNQNNKQESLKQYASKIFKNPKTIKNDSANKEIKTKNQTNSKIKNQKK